MRNTVHRGRQAGFPLEVLYIDLVGPLPTTTENYRYIMTVEDGYSRFVQAYPLRTKEAPETARVLLERFISTFGCPQTIHSDNGKEFTADVFKTLMEELQINKTFSPPYNPQSNLVERFHRTLNAFVRTSIHRDDLQWHKLLASLTLAYNSKVNVSTGVTPHLAFLGREVRLPLDLMIEMPVRKTVHQTVRDMLDRMKTMYKYIKRNGDAVLRRNAAAYTGRNNAYNENDLVWYLSPRKVKTKPPKLTNHWLGPFRVVKQVSEVLLKITPAIYAGKTYTVHVGRIKPYLGKLNEAKGCNMPGQLDLDDEGDMEGQELQADRPVRQPELGVPVYTPKDNTVTIEDAPTRGQTDPAEEAQHQPPPNMEEPQDELQSDTSDDDLPEASPSGANSGRVLTRTTPLKRQLSPGEETVRPAEHKRLHRRGEKKPRERRDTDQGGQNKVRKLLTETSEESSTEISDEANIDQLTNEVVEVKVKCQPNSQVPVKQTQQAVGFDLHSSENVEVPPGNTKVIGTGIHLELPENYFGKIEGRSGLASKGIFPVGGILDSDYRGEIKVILHNTTSEPWKIKKSERMAQLLIHPVVSVNLIEEDTLNPTQRGEQGFGSTGK